MSDYAESVPTCFCGMTADEHVPHQSRCPLSPEAVRRTSEEVQRFLDMFPADNSHVTPPGAGQ